jgi:hypothetical protein
MSLRGHKSRQIGPSFLRRRRIPPTDAQRRYVRSPFRSLEQAAMRWFRSQQRRFGKPRIPRSMQIMKRSPLVSIPTLSGHTLRATSSARRHVAALLSGLLSQIEFGPLLQNARLGTWEPGLSLGLRQGVTRPIREFKQRRLTMYQNRITLIGFLGNDAITRTANNATRTRRPASTTAIPSGIAASSGAGWPSTRRRLRRALICPSKESFVAANRRRRRPTPSSAYGKCACLRS